MGNADMCIAIDLNIQVIASKVLGLANQTLLFYSEICRLRWVQALFGWFNDQALQRLFFSTLWDNATKLLSFFSTIRDNAI